MKNVSAHSAKSPANWLVNPFTDWKADLVSAIQNVPRALFVCAVLMFVLAFALPMDARAQNTSSAPYYNSWHQYAVIPMGNTGNTYEWRIYNNEANALAYAAVSNPSSYELTEPLSWVQNRTTASGNAYIEIYFDKTILAPGTWYLVYSEFSASTGTCVARRSMAITPVDNTFYLTLGADNQDCHPLNNTVLNWDDYNGIRHTSNLEFTVNMNKASGFAPKSWSFKVTPSFGSYGGNTHVYQYNPAVSFTGTTTNGHSYTVTYNASDITVTVTGTTSGLETDQLTLNVPVSGYVYEGQVVTLTLTEGVARSGNTYEVITNDNTEEPNPPPITTPRVQQLTILPLPATSNIAIVD